MLRARDDVARPESVSTTWEVCSATEGHWISVHGLKCIAGSAPSLAEGGAADGSSDDETTADAIARSINRIHPQLAHAHADMHANLA